MAPLDRAPRKAVNLLIRVNAADEAAFSETYATNISSGGMFIRTRQPKPLGSMLQFRVELADGARVLQGTATVTWVRAAAATSADERAGSVPVDPKRTSSRTNGERHAAPAGFSIGRGG